MDIMPTDEKVLLLSDNSRLRGRIAELEIQLTFMQGVLTHVPDVIARFDRSLRHTYISPAITEITGLPPEAFMGKTNRDLNMPSALIEQWDTVLNHVFASGEPTRITFAFPGARNEYYYEAYVVPEYAANGTIDAVVSVARDVTERIKVEQALRLSQALLQGILDHAPVTILVKDRQGRFQLVSQNMLTALGLTDYGQLLGKTDTDILPQEVCVQLRVDDAQIFATGQALQREYTLPVGDTVRHVLSVGFPIYDPAGMISAIGYISTNISARKQIEAVLREREAMLRAIGDNLPNGMIYQFVYNPDRSWYYTYVSAGIERLSGITEAQLLKNPVLLRDMIVPEDRERMHAAEAESFEQLTTFDIEVHKRLPSGELRWSHLCSQPRRMDDGRVVWDGIETDITEQKRTEEALYQLTLELERRVVTRTAQLMETIQRLEREAAERFRAETALRENQRFMEQVAAVSPVILSVYDLTTRRMVYANPQLEAMLGYKSSGQPELTMATMLKWLHPDDIAAASAIREGYDGLVDGEVFTYEFRVREAEGRWRWFATRATVFARTATGQVAQVLVAAVEVTERRQAEEKLREYHHRLIEVQEAERVHLARELHDEIGQILTGLNLVLEAGMHGDLTAAKHQIRAAQALVNDLTTRVRQLSLDLRPAMLDDFGLLSAVNWLIKRYTEQTGLLVHIRHTGLDVMIAPAIATTAYRIIQETLTNVARHAGATDTTLELWATDAALYIQITDFGPGFDLDVALTSTTSSGLIGMRERVRLLGGIITIDSSPGQGTRVVTELPLS